MSRTLCPVGRLRQDLALRRVRPPQCREGKAGRAVLVFEEPRDFLWAALLLPIRIEDGRRRFNRVPVAGRLQQALSGLPLFLNEVVDQANTVALHYRQRFMFAVRVKRRERNLRRVTRVGFDGDFAAAMPDAEGSAAIERWKRHYQGPEHPGNLLRVPVRKKESAAAVDEQVVQRC